MFRVNLHMSSNLPIFLPRFRWGHRTLWHRFKREKCRISAFFARSKPTSFFIMYSLCKALCSRVRRSTSRRDSMMVKLYHIILKNTIPRRRLWQIIFKKTQNLSKISAAHRRDKNHNCSHLYKCIGNSAAQAPTESGSAKKH